jgi:hypothetical protein
LEHLCKFLDVQEKDMNFSKVSHLPVAALLATLIMVGMPALARLQPKPSDDPWLKMRSQLFPVAGTLLFEGKPVSGAVVTFVSQKPEEDREYLAVSSTDKDGRFWLRTFSTYGDGAMAGLHRIRVERLVQTGRMIVGYDGMTPLMDRGTIPSWLDPESASQGVGPGMDPMMDSMMGCSAFPGMPETVNVLPPRFADEKTSGLTAEVATEGTNEFLIQLEAEPPAAVDPVTSDDLPPA